MHGTKRTVADTILHSEVRRIVRDLLRERPDLADALGGEPAIVDAVAEVMACFGVYRSYLRPEDPDAGREHLEAALAAAREHRADLAGALDVLAGPLGDPALEATRRVQQTSGMVMAKGVEDCAFYRWSPLTSLTEVGGDPSEFSLAVTDFHDRMARRQAERPHAMTAGSTHDTKRGEDTRARISVLAEVPELWEAALGLLLDLAPVPDAGFGSCCGRPSSAAGPPRRPVACRPTCASGCTATPRRRCARPATAPRGPLPTPTTSRRCTPPSTPRWTAPTCTTSSSASSSSSPARAGRTRSRPSCVASPPPASPTSTRAASCGSRAWSTPTTAAPSTSPPGRGPWPRCPPAPPSPVDPTTTASPSCAWSAPRCACAATAPSCSPAMPRSPPTGPADRHVVAFDRGGAITVATRLPVGLSSLGGWGDHPADLPAPAPWRDVVSDRVVGPDLADVLATYPVALLVREG